MQRTCRVLMTAIALVAGCVLPRAQALGGNDEFQFTPTPVPEEAAWHTLGSSKKEGILELLRAQTKANYERIKTWVAVYRIHEASWWSPIAVTQAFDDRLPQGCTPDLIADTEKTFKAAIDQKAAAIFREFDVTRSRYLRTDTREPVVIPDTGGEVSRRSIATPEMYVYFDFKDPPSGWGVLPDHPEAQNKRAAHRVAVEDAHNPRKEFAAELMDPRQLYQCATSGMSWDDLEIDLKALRGKLNPGKQREVEQMRIDQAQFAGGTWYRLRKSLPPPPDGSRQWQLLTIWGSPAGYNPVSLKFVAEYEEEQIVRQSFEWNWTQVDGIYVPAAVRHVLHPADPGNIDTFDRTMVLQECTLNKPIAPEQFTYAGLGLGAGDLILDEVDQVVYVLGANGEPKRLAAFHEPYIPPPSPQQERKRLWFWLVAVNVVALLGAAAWLIWHRKSGRPE